MTKANASRSALLAHPALIAMAGALALSACGGSEPDAAAPPRSQSAPAAAAPAQAAPAPSFSDKPDSRGVVVYTDYAAIQARRGDTVQAMAQRVGVSASELAAYNGLPTSYLPSPGDELVLPPRAGGYSATAPAAAAPSTSDALSAAPAAASSAAAAASAGDDGWSPSRIEQALGASDTAAAANATAASANMAATPSSGPGGSDVGYHEVKSGETVYSIARAYGVQPATLIAWNALSGPGYSVSPGQTLVIPGAAAAASTPTKLAENLPGEAGAAQPPIASGKPLPPDTAPVVPLTSPQMSQYQAPPPAAPNAPAPSATQRQAAAAPAGIAAPETTAAAKPASVSKPAAPGKMVRPVPGKVISSYNPTQSGTRNDGVDFAAKAGEPVRAAASGTVALVSRSLGEWGNIVLIRHDDRMMTVYGRMGDVAVTKGQTVAAGEVIGDVAPPEGGAAASLHFEVRKGAFSEDPSGFF